MADWNVGDAPSTVRALFNTIKGSPGLLVSSTESAVSNADYTCDGTADEVQINAAITASAALTYGGTVFLTGGLFSIADSIIIKSNVRLVLTGSTKIFLANNANHYMVINDDFTGGTSNFTITGGRWYGNRTNQTKDWTGADPSVSYWGNGFVFKNCTDFYFGDCYIEDTVFWAILYHTITNCVFKNIRFMQLNTASSSQDGITGTGAVNMLIENISGYCTDDMLAIGCSDTAFTKLGGVLKTWGDSRDSKNIVIKNIYLEKNESDVYSCYGIGLYATEDATLENIVIDGVYGGISEGVPLIRMTNWFGELEGKGNWENIDISNINIELVAANQGIVNINALFATGDARGISVRDVKVINSQDSRKDLISMSHGIDNLTISNITCKNTVGTYKHRLLVAQAAGRATKINISGVDRASDIDPIIALSLTQTGSRVNAPECYTDRLSDLDGQLIGDRMMEQTTWHPMLYTTKWIDLIDGSDI